MNLKQQLLALFFVFTFVLTGNAQKNEETQATSVATATSFEVIPSIASRTYLEPADVSEREIKDGRSGRNQVLIGKDRQAFNDILASNPNPLEQKYAGKAPSLVFDAYSSGSTPSDPAGAVGPNHYISVFNTGFRIFAKDGTPLTGQLSTDVIFPQSGCCDLTVSYDAAVDRFVMSFLGSGVQVAVTSGPDPVNDEWYTYNFPGSTDYQKISIWSDGYYMTANKNSGSAGTSEVVFALERDKMLTGDASAQVIGFPLPGITTSGFYSPQAFNVTNDNLPATGGAPIVYLQDDAWGGVSEDHVKLWTIDVDWSTPANSTISAATTITTSPFISVFDGGNFSNLSQPGGGQDVDALQATIMNQAQFRKFGDHNSAIFNFVIDTDASAGELAGVRWIELRQDADNMPWTLYQEGTYTAPDEKHAWNASMAMDIQGNIGMGYTAMGGSTATKISSYYTGRYANDPAGTMTVEETLIAEGTANDPSFRYGDYSKLAVDPSDDKTFWFINEYFKGGRKGVVGVFKLAPDFDNDIGVVSIDSPVSGTLTNSETITVTIFNYGENAASNFPVTYSIDGGGLVSETFSGSIASGETAQYTFSATGDFSTVGQTYEIVSATNMSGDEDNSNDATTSQVTHLEPNDIGVSAITSPVSGTDLSNAESIVVTINNFGGESQSNFDVSYDLDGNVVTETIAGPLAGDSSMSYTFTQTGDFSTIGSYSLSAYTSLSGDSDTSNDSTSVTIIKSNCAPVANCTLGDGFRLFQVGTIDNPSECGENGYSNFTSMSTDLAQGTTYDLTVTTGYGSQYIRVWIDFNDDFTFSLDELVVDNYQIAPEEGSGSFTETMDLVIPATATLGSHLMRAKSNWSSEVPDDACEGTQYGETEDYMANITGEVVGLNENVFSTTGLVVQNHGDNHFTISLMTTTVSHKLTFTVSNIIGQKLISYNLDNKNGTYTYDLDMSYANAGVYIVRIGNETQGRAEKIIVK